MIVLGTFLACDGANDDTGIVAPVYGPQYGPQQFGSAPWDPVLVHVWPRDTSSHYFGEPLILDADGTPATLEPIAFSGYWVPSGDGLEPGEWTIAGVDGEQLFEVALTIEPWGRNVEFDSQSVQGKVYELRPDAIGVITQPMGPGDLIGQFASRAWIEIVDVSVPGQATFRVYYEGEAGICRVAEETGTLSPTGELNWTADEVRILADPTPIVAKQLRIRLGFSSDGASAAGGMAQMTLDTRPFASVLSDEDELAWCSIMMDVTGLDCVDCTGDGATCLPLRFDAALLSAVDRPWEEEPPACGIALDGLEGRFSCDLDVSNIPTCATGSSSLMIFAFWRSRRRTKAS